MQEMAPLSMMLMCLPSANDLLLELEIVCWIKAQNCVNFTRHLEVMVFIECQSLLHCWENAHNKK